MGLVVMRRKPGDVCVDDVDMVDGAGRRAAFSVSRVLVRDRECV